MAKDKKNHSLIEDYSKHEEPGFFTRLKQSLPRVNMLLGLMLRRVPAFYPLVLLRAVTGSLQVALAVFVPKFIIDLITNALPWREALYRILLVTAAELALRFVANEMNKQMELMQHRIDNELSLVLAEKISRLPYSSLEDPEILTMKEEATFVLTNQGAAYRLVEQIYGIAQYLLTSIGLLILLARLSIVLVLVILVIVALIALLQNSIKSYETLFYKNIVGVNRKFGYFLDQSYSAEQQPAIRLYQQAPMISERVDEMNVELAEFMADYLNQEGRISGFQSILTDLQAAIAYGYAGLRVITGALGPSITLGAFSLYTASSIQFTANLRHIMNSLREIKQILDMLISFEQFMLLPDRETARETVQETAQETEAAVDEIEARNVLDVIRTVEFDRVSFTYPGTTTPVLKDVSFKIKQGTKISIVGLNGAGKTTIVKLLCRFFEPDSGRILINGIDLAKLPEGEYLEQLSAVFQDFRLLPFSLQSNIASCPDEAIDAKVMARIREIADETSVASIVSTQEHGFETKLDKSINQGGTELSGGQAQKLAIARALYKGASLVILDEPTSALDPLAEAEIYEHFDTLVCGQTAIYISHRMSSARFCDKVLVLEEGTVTGFAHHNELIRDKTSLYSRLFDEQSQYYQTT